MTPRALILLAAFGLAACREEQAEGPPTLEQMRVELDYRDCLDDPTVPAFDGVHKARVCRRHAETEVLRRRIEAAAPVARCERTIP